jgi:hypothetical protein
MPVSHAERWQKFSAEFREKFGKLPTTDSVFFIIGLEETYTGKALEKEEKTDVIAHGFYKVFEAKGYFQEVQGISHPVTEKWKAIRQMPEMTDAERAVFFEQAILDYISTKPQTHPR